MTPEINIKNDLESLLQAEAALHEAQDAPEESSPFVTTHKGEPNGLSEHYWIEAIAATGDFIYEPAEDRFYIFADGLWNPSTRQQVNNRVVAFIRKEASEYGLAILDKLVKKKSVEPIVDMLSGHPSVFKQDAFANPPSGIVLVQNGRIQILESGELIFDSTNRGCKSDLQTSRIQINYDPEAKATRTLTWLRRVFSDREDDVTAIQKAAGTCVLGSSRHKRILYIEGAPDLGKSQIPLLLQALVGSQKCAAFETKRLGEQFEMRRFVGKVLLFAGDVEPDFMGREYAPVLKSLTGFDPKRVVGKYVNEESLLNGDKLIMMTANCAARIKTSLTGNERGAWERRICYLVADGKAYEEDEQDDYFIRGLFADDEEASGILNWALAGASDLSQNKWIRSEAQMARLMQILDASGHVEKFVRECFSLGDHHDRPGVTLSEGWSQYIHWCEAKGVTPWEERVARELLVDAVQKVWGKTTSNSIERSTIQRGWRGIKLESIKD